MITASIFAGFTGLVALFQLSLALGMPWGEYANGGRWPGRLPAAMRLTSLFNMLLLIIMAAVVLVRAGVLLPSLYPASEWAIWFVFAFTVLSVVLHIMTPSKKERRLWLPVVAIMCVTCLLTALS